MRVGFYFGREIYSDAKSGGAFTFTQSVFRQLCKVKTNHEIYIFADDADKLNNSEYIKFVKINRFYSNSDESFFKRLSLKIPRKILRILQNRKYKNALNQAVLENQIELMWFATPAYEQVDTPYVYTVWDLQHRLQTYFPEVSIADNAFEAREKSYDSIIPKASFVVTGNEAGKKEVSKFYSYPENRIKTLPLPTPDFILKEDFEKTNHRVVENILFYPAQFWPHKNHIVILLALKILKEKHGLDFKIVFTGSDKGNLDYIKSKIFELGLNDRVEFLGFVSVEKLIELYKNSFALVFSSFFGPDNIPPLEAFALGCPVISAKVSGSEYQLKDAAILFDPKSEIELATAINKLYEDIELRNKLIKNGLQIAQGWTSKEYVQGVFKIVDDFEPIRRCWSSKNVYKEK